jgi:hypothetical protein
VLVTARYSHKEEFALAERGETAMAIGRVRTPPKGGVNLLSSAARRFTLLLPFAHIVGASHEGVVLSPYFILPSREDCTERLSQFLSQPVRPPRCYKGGKTPDLCNP